MDVAALEYLFAPVAPFSSRRMFGGLGLFKNGLMFALVADGIVYIKAASSDIPALEALGCSPFSFERTLGTERRLMVTSYWSLPSDGFEDPDIVAHWAMRAIAAADASQAKRPSRKN